MIFRCNANSTKLTAIMGGCETGEGGGRRHVNRIRKAYYFYFILYFGGDSSYFPKPRTN